jgi:hypothetical protein
MDTPNQTTLKSDDTIIWNNTKEKGIQIVFTIDTKPNTAKLIYYLVSVNSNLRGRLIGTCLPETLSLIYYDLNLYKRIYRKIIHWPHPDYFLLGTSIIYLLTNNTDIPTDIKYELHHWPEICEYPRLALNIPGTTISNGCLTLFLIPENSWIEYQYTIGTKKNKTTQNNPHNSKLVFIANYDDIIYGPKNGLGSRRCQRKIFKIPYST